MSGGETVLSKTATYASCCSHYVFGDAIDVDKGEGSIYLHYMLRRNMHFSNTLPLQSVFGPPPSKPVRKVDFAFTDIPCQVLPAIRKIDEAAAGHADLLLGQLHSHAHSCQMKNAGIFKGGTGAAFGEEIELQWAKVAGLSSSLKYTSSSNWYDRLGQAMNQVSADAIEKIPGLLFDQVCILELILDHSSNASAGSFMMNS
jgi:hypothetical protein